MNIRCWGELVKYGALDVLRREYGALLSNEVEPDYNVSLKIDLTQTPPEGGQSLKCSLMSRSVDPPDHTEARDAWIISLALLKRNALAAPFERAFQAQKDLESRGASGDSSHGELMEIHYRDEEAIYVQANSDRVTVFFSTVFREETDRIFGKVFLQVCDVLLFASP